jgi:hypothetical protein
LPLSRDSRQERKLKALKRAEFRLKQAFERIDWEEDELIPLIEALKAGKAVLGLPEGAAFDIVIESDADSTQNTPSSHGSDPSA